MENKNVKVKNEKAKCFKKETLRIKPELKNKINADLAKVNKKKLGKKLKTDDYLELAISLIKSEHLKQLQEASLSHFDRLELNYLEYNKKHSNVSKDAYLGILLSGKIKIESATESFQDSDKQIINFSQKS